MKEKKDSKTKEAQEQKQAAKLENWEKHLAGAKEKEFYSIKRIDVLIISISGACIYIVLETLKFLHTPEIIKLNLSSCTILLKISAISSVIAIAINFVSQISGYKANGYEAKYSREVINQLEDGVNDENKLEAIDKKSELYNNITSIMNITSSIFMALGIVFLVLYFAVTF